MRSNNFSTCLAMDVQREVACPAVVTLSSRPPPSVNWGASSVRRRLRTLFCAPPPPPLRIQLMGQEQGRVNRSIPLRLCIPRSPRSDQGRTDGQADSVLNSSLSSEVMEWPTGVMLRQDEELAETVYQLKLQEACHMLGDILEIASLLPISRRS